MRSRKNVLALALGSVLLVSTALPTLAAKPATDPVPFPEDGILLPAGVFCDVDVFVEAIRNTEKSKTFAPDDDGNVLQIVTGQLWITATNLATDASALLKISGPYKVLIMADETIEITYFGQSVAVQPPGLVVTSGRVVQVLFPDGSSEILSSNGGALDVCALLGAASA